MVKIRIERTMRHARRQLELYDLAARTEQEAEQQAHALSALTEASDDPGSCSRWSTAAAVADLAGLPVPDTRAALYVLLYRRAVRRREGDQAEEWTTAPRHLDACQGCGACYPRGRQVDRPNDEPEARPEDLCSRQ